MQLDQRLIGVGLAAIEYDRTAVRTDVELARRELAAEVRQLPADAGTQVDVPTPTLIPSTWRTENLHEYLDGDARAGPGPDEFGHPRKPTGS